MGKYEQLMKQLMVKEDPSLYAELVEEIRINHKSICTKQHKDASGLGKLLTNGIRDSKPQWWKFMNKLLACLYELRSPLLELVYRRLPSIIIKLIKINEVKYEGFEECLMLLYNHEHKKYNEWSLDKGDFTKDAEMRKLYLAQVGKQMVEFKASHLHTISTVNNQSKNQIKILLFFLIYTKVMDYDEDALYNYYKCLFIYCGVDEKEVNRQYSLYLLEKKNLISIFKYGITEEEFEWIILTLYELSIRVKKHKFELLAAINILHKKASNQCQFKISQVANSLIHLLEDEYSQVFS